MWTIFRTACRKLECKSEWRWRRHSRDNRTVWTNWNPRRRRRKGSWRSQSRAPGSAGEKWVKRKSPDHRCVNVLQLFLRKHRKGGDACRPCAQVFRWSANWVPWWMTFKNRLSFVPKPPIKGFLVTWFSSVCVCCGECKGYTTAL